MATDDLALERRFAPEGPEPWVAELRGVRAERQILPLGGTDWTTAPAFLYFEATGESLDLRAEIRGAGLWVGCAKAGGASASPSGAPAASDLSAYLYLDPPGGAAELRVTAAEGLGDEALGALLPWFVVQRADGTFDRVPAEAVAFDGPGARRVALPERARRVGVPLFAGAAWGCAIAAVRAASPSSAARGEEEAALPKRPSVVFSMLFAEEDSFLAAVCDNFHAFAPPDAVLLVNLGPDRAFPSWGERRGRCLLFRGETRRAKWGHTLLVGHLESVAEARRRFGSFGLFAAMASNSLFFRPFSLAAVAPLLAAPRRVPPVPLGALPDEWHWRYVRRNPEMIEALRRGLETDALVGNQIEGLIAGQADWEAVERFRPVIEDAGATMRPDGEVPFEEFVPATVFRFHGSDRYAHTCHFFTTMTRPVSLAQLLAPTALPPEVSAVKWFERSANAPATIAVTEAWARGLLDAARAATGPRALGLSMLLRETAALLEPRLGARPLLAGREHLLPPEGADGLRRLAFRDVALAARGQTLWLPGGVGHLALENTGAALPVEIEILHAPAATQLRLRVGGEAAREAPIFQGRLVLACAPPRSGAQAGVRLRAPEAQAEALEDSLPWHAMERDGTLLPFPRLGARALREAGEAEFAFLLRWPQPGGEAGYALPLFAGLALDLRVECLF